MRSAPRSRTRPSTTPATPAAPGGSGTASSWTAARPAATPAPAPDPVRDRALFAAFSGDPAVVVSSPPGAGKTALVTGLAQQLTARAGFDVAIAAQTRAQAVDVANRAAAAGAPVTLLVANQAGHPAGLAPGVALARRISEIRDRRRVVVATTARWQNTRNVEGLAEVLIVDEAWQMTYADLGGLGVLAAQVVLVGDPGQIDPVVTAPTRRWESWGTGPHLPAPDALCTAHPDGVITRLRLPHTYRLGPTTTKLLQPFYADPFDSHRADSAVVLDGADLPEITVTALDAPPDPASPAVLDPAVARARELIGRARVRTDQGERPLSGADVAVVVPHRTQAARIEAALADEPEVLVGTANQLQGAERHAVVVVHPLCGHRDLPAFGTDPARLCVALSRHRSHATLVLDRAVPDALDHAGNDPVSTLHRNVLAQLP